jgi:hypothetical protein
METRQGDPFINGYWNPSSIYPLYVLICDSAAAGI